MITIKIKIMMTIKKNDNDENDENDKNDDVENDETQMTRRKEFEKN